MASLYDETDSVLVRRAGNGSPRGMLGPDGPQAELTRRLMGSIDRLNDTSTQLQVKMLDLTRWLVGLTVAMILVGLVQIVLVGVMLSR